MSAGRLHILSMLLFAVLVVLGLLVASRKPLWNDELFSLSSSVQGASYSRILTGRLGSSEGNVNPLFYLTQKLFLNAAGYRMPYSWEQGDWSYQDTYSQVVVRVLPVLCMAGAIVLIFYFFSHYYGWLTGFYSLAVSLSSYMVWAYGAEARPYALWFFLTTAQLLGVLVFIREPKRSAYVERWLIMLHVLLSLTVTLSILQITAVAVLWRLLGRRDWRLYCWMWLLPLLLTGFYYLKATKLNFFFVEGFGGLIGASYPQDRLAIAVVFVFCWLLAVGVKNGWWKTPFWFSGIGKDDLRLTGFYMGLSAFIFTAVLAVLVLLKLKEVPAGEGFQISCRYFICLAPLGIIATSLFSYYLVISHNKQWRICMLVFLLVFLVWRINRTMALAGSLQLL